MIFFAESNSPWLWPVFVNFRGATWLICHSWIIVGVPLSYILQETNKKKLVYLLNLWAVWKDCETKWWQITRTELLEENPLVIPAQMHNHIQFHHLHTFHTYVYMCTVDENVNVCIVHTKGCVQKKSPHPRKQLFISDTPTTIASGRREPLWESHIDKHQGKRRLSSLLCGPHLCIFIKAFQMFSDKNIKKLINAAFFASSLPCYLVIIFFLILTNMLHYLQC